MSSEKLNLVVFLGSVRQGRLADRVGKFIRKQLESRGHRVTILDPLELKLGEVHQPLHFYRNPAEAPEILRTVNKTIQDADAFVAVAAEYNSAISPSLCSIMDHFPPASYSWRPSCIVTYSMGNYGGIRAAMQLREFLSELTTVHMPSMVVISKAHERLTDDGEPTGEGVQLLPKAAADMINQLEWYAAALKNHRASGCPKIEPFR
ncbi:uncharacterized protein LOC129585161 [Paramacrobiotus metropolitanus]|uniref:uncharacterized protein LOC129585161 n=1 Tax=Paramacrobiotus metropolitanus TaxID=2943436 RepID=UPI002445A671|nr:uncharacterized protein LOC129585161 [Paramacrobiotus metropolitanus]